MENTFPEHLEFMKRFSARIQHIRSWSVNSVLCTPARWLLLICIETLAVRKLIDFQNEQICMDLFISEYEGDVSVIY